MNWKYENQKLVVEGRVIPLTTAKILKELKETLLDPEATGPDPAYWVFRDVKDPQAPEGMRSDVTILASGTIGREYVRTHGHYHLGEGVERYKLLAGSAFVLMQKPTFNFDGVEAVRLVHMPVGQLVEIPSGWGHTVINIGDEKLVVENYEPPAIDQLYSVHDKMHGAAYYVLQKDSQPVMEPNPNYKDLPKLQTF